MIIPPTPEAMQAAMNSIRNLENQVTRVAVGHCKDCKWWGGCPWLENVDDKKFKGCAHPMVNDVDERGHPDGIMLYKSIDTSVMTGPDFGCVHFEQKANQPKRLDSADPADNPTLNNFLF